MMKFCQSTQLILKLYGLKSQIRPQVLFLQFLESHKPHKEPSIEERLNLFTVWKFNLFDKPVVTLAVVKEANVLR